MTKCTPVSSNHNSAPHGMASRNAMESAIHKAKTTGDNQNDHHDRVDRRHSGKNDDRSGSPSCSLPPVQPPVTPPACDLPPVQPPVTPPVCTLPPSPCDESTGSAGTTPVEDTDTNGSNAPSEPNGGNDPKECCCYSRGNGYEHKRSGRRNRNHSSRTPQNRGGMSDPRKTDNSGNGNANSCRQLPTPPAPQAPAPWPAPNTPYVTPGNYQPQPTATPWPAPNTPYVTPGNYQPGNNTGCFPPRPMPQPCQPPQPYKPVQVGGDGNDTLTGTNGNDTQYGGNGCDTLNGGNGNDIQHGGNDMDRLEGGAGDDTQYGGKGDDALLGGAGNDTQYGGDGHDELFGGEGNDKLFGGKGSDLLDGGAGNDLLKGGDGSNHLIGGEGCDTAIYDQNKDCYTITTTDGKTYIVDAKGNKDTLESIEKLQFKDQTFDIPVGPQGTPMTVEGNTIKIGDRYTIALNEGEASWTITDKCDDGVTKVWGDPHVNTNGGGANWDFKKNSTFELEDGTKITVGTTNQTAIGDSLSSSLTITNGDNAVKVTGLAAGVDGANNMKITQSTDGKALDAATSDGAFTAKETGKGWTIDGQAANQAVVNAKEAAAA